MEPLESEEVPPGAAVFPFIPEELGVHPLLLAVLHTVVFLDGSAEEVVHPGAADEVSEYLVTYLHRIKEPELQRIREDLQCLLAFARQEKWPPEGIEFLQDFIEDYGVGGKS